MASSGNHAKYRMRTS